MFSLGATLCTALEGTPPFGLNTNAIALLHQVASGEITPPRQSDPLTPLLLRLLQRDPEQRPTMQQAHDALATLAAGPAGPAGGPSVPAPPPPRHDGPFEPVPSTQETLIQQAPLEERFSSGRSTGLNAIAGRAPAEGDHHGGSGRRGLLLGVMTLALLAVGVLVAMLISHGNVTGGNVAQSRQALPAQPGPSSTTPAAPIIIPAVPSQSSQALPSPPGPSSTTEVDPTTAPAVPGSPQNTPEQLQGAITDYYALVPGNLPAAWNRLTANYQQSHAGGFTGYQNFWSPVQRVTVSNVSAKQGDAVDATVDYFFKDGRVVEEQTSYGLVAEDGLWKIDSSTVSSSQSK